MKPVLAKALSASFAQGAAVTPATAVPAVLLSPLLSTVGVVCYERWQGTAISLNLWKCSFVSILFTAIVMSSSTAALTALSPLALRMLILSSFLGIVIGDVLWLQALKLLGARMCILQSTLQPLMAALAGSIFLKQPLAPTAGFGIVAVCAGLALAQFASAPSPSPPPAATQNDWERAEEEAASALVAEEGEGELSANSGALLGAGGRLLLGSCLNLMNLAFDTAGSVITRRYGVGCTTWQINMVRFGSAALMTLAGLGCANAYFAVARPQEARPEWTATAPPQPAKVWMAVGGGALLVTFLAPALSNHALFGLNLGVWSALASLGPVWSVPVLYVLRRERTSGRGLLGAALAVVGAAACSAAARASG